MRSRGTEWPQNRQSSSKGKQQIVDLQSAPTTWAVHPQARGFSKHQCTRYRIIIWLRMTTARTPTRHKGCGKW